MLVGVGWFVTAVAASVVGEWSVPRDPDREVTVGYLPAVVVMLGAPLLLTLLVVTAGVTRLRIPAALAGTLSAAATAVIVTVVYQVSR